MWCKKCRQDVPGVPSKGGKLRCLRCGKLASSDATVDSTINIGSGVEAMADHGLDLDAAGRGHSQPTWDFDDWDLDPELRSFRNARAAHKLAEMPATASTAYPGAPSAAYPTGMPLGCAWEHPAATAWPGAEAVQGWGQRHAPAHSPRQESATRASWLAWTIMSAGLMAFMCGGVLLGWSYLASRTDLWNLGIPVAVGGQIALLVGLVLQLERIWQNNRYAVDKLEEVDERLADMKHSQALLNVNRGSAAQAFYTHMAEGANPSLLLADLKGQLDLLAIRLSERR